MLREHDGVNWFTGSNKLSWVPKMGAAKIYTDLATARKDRSKLKKTMKIKNSKIEIVELQLVEISVK